MTEEQISQCFKAIAKALLHYRDLVDDGFARSHEPGEVGFFLHELHILTQAGIAIKELQDDVFSSRAILERLQADTVAYDAAKKELEDNA